MNELNRTRLLENFINLLIKRQQMLISKDLLADLRYWEKQYDMDTPLINDIIRLTEDYTKKYHSGQGCLIISCIIMIAILYGLAGGAGIVVGIICSIYSLNHISVNLFGQDINNKEVDNKIIIEKKVNLETNLKKHIMEGSNVPETFANVKAIRQAQKILADNPLLTPKEVYAQLKIKKELYANTLTQQEKMVLVQLPCQIKSYYIFSKARTSKL